MGDLEGTERGSDFPETIPVETIEQSALFKRLGGVAEPTRLATARLLALILLFGFVGALAASFLLGFYVLWGSNSFDEKTLTLATVFVKVTGSIFTPLLAFVLGFYFSKGEE